jgi:hypothetical protein
MKTIFLLLVIYQLKHFIADYPLQGKYMLGKFKKGTAWILPLLAHVGVHGAFTLVIACAFHCQYAPLLALLDMTLHFIMDRIKASPNLLGRYQAVSKNEMMQIIEDMRYYEQFPGTPTTQNCKPHTLAKIRSNVLFWWCLGLDQMVHHLTHYIIIYLILVTT